MADKNADALNDLFHEEALFVHMGGTMTKKQEHIAYSQQHSVH
ncbi:MAG: nuclear transport factor 2 family protein [Tannerellaceae bacterium]|nr:nuclear transport factor 2 family protein [Tannerellaceae bacterium]